MCELIIRKILNLGKRQCSDFQICGSFLLAEIFKTLIEEDDVNVSFLFILPLLLLFS